MKGTTEAGTPLSHRPRLRASLFALAPLAVLAAFLWPILSGARTWYLRDLFNYHLSAKAAQARAMREGVLPLVDPFRASGQALVGNLNNVALYPDNLLYLVASPVWALNAHLWIHLLLAPVAVYWLARAFDLEREAAWVAGFCYALSGFFLSQLNLYNLVASAALAPAFAAACLTSLHGRRPALGAAAAGALLSLVALGGDPIVGAFTVFLGLAACLTRRPVDRSRVVALIVALGCGTLVAAPQIVELWRVLGSSYRGSIGLGPASRLVASWDPRGVVEFFLPLFFGPPGPRFWGSIFAPSVRPLYYSLYPGALAIALVIAAGRPGERSNRWAWWMILAGAFFALGGWNPIMFLFYRLPLASGLRYPIKAWILIAIGASLLAGLGFERAFHRGSRRPLLLVLAGLGLTAAMTWMALSIWRRPAIEALAARITPELPAAYAVDQVEQWRASLAISLAVLVVAALLVACSRRAPRIAGCLLIATHVAAQLFLLRPIVATDDTAAYRAAPPALSYIAAGERVVHGCSISIGCDIGGPGAYPDDRTSWPQRRGWVELYPYAGVQHGLRYAYNVSPERLDTVFVFAAQQAMRDLTDRDALRVLAAAAVDVVLLDYPLVEAARDLVDLRARLPSIGGELWVYGIRDSAPDARLARSVQGGDPRRVLLEMIAPGFDAATAAFLPGRPAETETLEEGTAEIDSESWERLSLTTASPGKGLLVLGRAWLPHYRARIDGAPAPTLQANFGQLAVELPPGRHHVEIWVDRRPFQAALGASVLGLCGLVLLVARGVRRDHPPGR